MQMLRAFAALVVVLALASPALGQSAPEGFRDLKWGATQEDVQRAFPQAICRTQYLDSSDWICFGIDETVNDVAVTVLFDGYKTGRVAGMKGFSLSSQSDGISRILDAFESRYGGWTREEKGKVPTRGGGWFPTKYWSWDFPDVWVTIVQNQVVDLNKGQAVVGLRGAHQEPEARAAARKGEAGKGL